MRPRNLIPIALFAVFVAGLSTEARAQQYDLLTLDTESGLRGSEINDITQDSLGYLWVATNNGISRFDGMEFVNYHHRQGLSENYCTTIFCDAEQRIWVGHQTGGVSIVGKDSVQRFTEENGLVNNEVHDVFQTSDGRIWVATFGGVSIFDGENWTTKTISDGLISNNIQVISEDENGAIWLGTFGSGINIINNDRIELAHRGNGLINNHVTSLDFADDRMLIGTLGGLSVWEKSAFRKKNELNVRGQVNDLAADKEGVIWLATYNGLSRLRDGGRLDLTEGNGLPDNEVLCVFIDAESNTWFGTPKGLVRVRNLAFSHYFSSEDLDIDPSSFFVDSKGKLWVGNEAGGVMTFEDGMFISAFEDPDINDHQISSIGEDGDGNLWFGTMDFGGLFQWDGEKLYIYSDEFGLADNNINCLLTDDDGILLIGTPNGLSIYDGEGFEIVPLSDDFSAVQVTTLEMIEEGIAGVVLVGTDNGSVYVYDKKRIMEPIPLQTESRITDMTETPFGTAFGTKDDGIWIISEGKTLHINQETGLHGSGVRSLYWSDNRLYAGTGQSIEEILFADDTFRIETHTKANGFLGGSCKVGAITKYGENILIGTDKGVTFFTPSELHPGLIKPKTHLTELQLSYQSVNWEGMGYKTYINGLPEDLVLSYTENSLRFFFKGIDHEQPEAVQYQWMLEGYEKDWTPYTNQRFANYPSLPPGDYTFKLVACNSRGICTGPISFTFKIRPPFWQTVWFYVLFILGAIAITYFYIKRRERVLLEEKQILESTVEERTKQLREQKEIVEKQNDHIIEGIEYAKNIQMAILPSDEEMNRAFSDNFIFYRPKETVGGDFYWVHSKGDISWAAAVDCTGHGVSGAFMSMIGSDLLNQIIIEKQIDDPASVLEEMDKGIKLAFAQSAKEFESDQGMDVSLIRLDKKMNTIGFAGAQRPLFSYLNRELTEIEGDRFSISCADGIQKTFKKHELKAEKGMVLYLFSDGIADQFGGEKGKKFMVRRLREQLQQNGSKTMKEQHALLVETLDDWKGDENQIDDLMLMGIQV